MLAVTLIHIGVLFFFGNPEWKPIVTGYLGLLLMGGCFISVGPAHLEPDQEPDRRRHGDVRRVPAAVDDQLDRQLLGPDHAERASAYLSIIEHFDDFSKGVIDTQHVVYYLSFITFGLFLTAKSVDSERWRG